MLDVIAHHGRRLRTPKTSSTVLAATAVLGLVGLLVAVLQRSTLSLAAYFVVLLLGTASIAYHRWYEARRSMQPDHVLPPRWQRRAALVPVALLLFSCIANAFVWATEAAKR